jgi:quercetin dioxygenase-like cupin family protein
MMLARSCHVGGCSMHQEVSRVMRRFSVLLSLIVVVLLGVLALSAQLVAIAQEATPAGVKIGGVTFEPVALATGIDLPSPGDLLVARAALDPGVVVPIEKNDPALGILLVESGTLTVQLEGPMTVTRGAGLGEAMATAEVTGDVSGLMESVPAGQAVTLAAGDAAYIPANVAGEIRNEGQERAVRLAILVLPPEGMGGEATPAP